MVSTGLCQVEWPKESVWVRPRTGETQTGVEDGTLESPVVVVIELEGGPGDGGVRVHEEGVIEQKGSRDEVVVKIGGRRKVRSVGSVLIVGVPDTVGREVQGPGPTVLT